MPVSQPPFSNDPPRSSWEYELTSAVNTLEGRAEALLELLPSAEALSNLETLISEYNAIQEYLSVSQLYIQDEQPSPVYSDTFMWLQTNVNADGDFTLWFCPED